jgi:precorrin-6B methylase 2
MTYLGITGHRWMAFDAERNVAYERALARVVNRDSVVLDLGAGTGVHGLLAAKLGAKRVYLVEPEDVIAVAEQNASANGVSGVVRCVQGRIEDVDLPEQVDVIVSVLTGNFLLTEDLLPSLFHARDRFLRPGGALVPDAAMMTVVPVSAPELHADEISCWSDVRHGIHLSAGRQYAANTVLFRIERGDMLEDLATPATVHTMDLRTSGYGALKTSAEFTITQDGLCHGWAGWLSIRLGDDWLSTSPRAAKTHWSWAFLPLDPPMTFEPGERVRFQLSRAPHGDWTWRTEAASGSQQHSTLLSVPLKGGTLQKAARQYRPSLTDEGRALEFVLTHCDGTRSVEAIAEALQALQPSRYRTVDDALRFVQVVVKANA